MVDIEAPKPLREWASRERLELLSFQRIWILKSVYRVTVRDLKGAVRNAHVRIGGWWFSLSDSVHVDWDD